jgi:hypothetical protein
MQHTVKNTLLRTIVEATLNEQQELNVAAMAIAERATANAKYFSHRTRRANKPSILKHGLIPQTESFKELVGTGNFSMFIGFAGNDLRLDHVPTVGGEPGDAVFVYGKDPKIISIYQAFLNAGTVNQRVLSLSDKIGDWFVSYETVYMPVMSSW